ncbi:hypothetical protein Tsubulata_049480 [Turnera subulata]|uniref:Uncharacterized protein n=1 Tax=Turnera subulata TaxID=218843 RepID=A0A9Q0G7P3_9ROSI|nr:hypothetical protein Tsubulata_049480 [Turnera subulata]
MESIALAVCRNHSIYPNEIQSLVRNHRQKGNKKSWMSLVQVCRDLVVSYMMSFVARRKLLMIWAWKWKAHQNDLILFRKKWLWS